MSQENNSTDVRRSQTITRQEQARELSPEEKLSPLDLEIYERVIEKAKLLPEEDYWVNDAITETAGLGSKQFIDMVRWLNVKLPENPIRIPSDKYRGRSIEDMQIYPLQKSEIVIGDENNILLAMGARICIYGKPKAAKSCLAIQLGMDLAAEGMFLGSYKVNKPHNVLYLNFELDEALFEERILLIKDAVGYGDMPGFRQLTLLGNDIPLLDTEEGYEQLREILNIQRSNGFSSEVLVLDCRWKTFRRSDNEGDVMRYWLANIESLQKEFQFIPIIVHHEGKSTTGMGAGSSNFDRWINTAIRIKTIQSKDDQQQETTTVLPSKRQLLIYGNYTGFMEIDTVFTFPLYKLSNGETYLAGRNKVEKATEFLFSNITERGGRIEQQELQKLAAQNSITSDTFKRALRNLEADKKITKHQDPDKPGRQNIVELTNASDSSHT